MFNVRRLTGLDLYGTAGTQRRRKVIRAEMVLGCATQLLLLIPLLVALAAGVQLIKRHPA